MDAVAQLAPTVGVLAACDVLGVARASFYRQRPMLGPPTSPAPELSSCAVISRPCSPSDGIAYVPSSRRLAVSAS
jgi:hypothetical protein